MNNNTIKDALEESKQEVLQENQQKKEEQQLANKVTKDKTKRSSTSFSLPPKHIELLDKLSEIAGVSRSEMLVIIIEFTAKIIPYRSNLDRICIEKPYIKDWWTAALHAIDEHFTSDQRIKDFDQKLKQAVQSMTLASENMLKLTAMQDLFKHASNRLEKQAESTQAIIRSLEQFTDQFGIKKTLVDVKKDVERVESLIRELRITGITTSRSMVNPSLPTMELEKITSKGLETLKEKDKTLEDIPQDVLDMIG